MYLNEGTTPSHPDIRRLEKKCTALFEILSEKQAVEVQEIINEAFGNSEIREEQMPQALNFIVKVLKDIIEEENTIYLPPCIKVSTSPIFRQGKRSSNRTKKGEVVNSESLYKNDHETLVDDVEDRNEGNKEDILEVPIEGKTLHCACEMWSKKIDGEALRRVCESWTRKVEEFRRMNKWHEENKLTGIEHAEIKVTLNVSDQEGIGVESNENEAIGHD
ncbi:hypothetical protein C2G38_2202913 [Gigaspora rosea]|uniref:Uncharacterized protein n=1 Tax=Gigaspora rosea TaxID=44941 RepID=A0A397US84_9GLOM|nr:hypothetical protein C2G38_2202913 [Gigaspora rosea]